MTTLLESRARPFGSSRGALISMAIHGAVIAAAVFATTQVVLPPREKVEEHPILYVATPPPKPIEAPPAPLPKMPTPPKAKSEKVFKAPPAPPKRAAEPRPTPVAQPKVSPTAIVVAPPTRVPTNIPKVDLKGLPNVNTDIVINTPPAPEAIRSSGIKTGGSVRESDNGEVGGKGGLSSGNSGKAFDENQVDRAVTVTRRVDPRYPDALKSVGVEGTVVMRFIVSADGRVEPGSMEAVSSPNSLFTASVKTALLQMRFRPAEAGGQAVRQLVQQPFTFVIK